MSSVTKCSPRLFSCCLLSFSVPNKVQGVSISNSARSDYLKVSWVHATGDFDHYEVTIKNKNNFTQTKSIPKSENECVFVQLVPGHDHLSAPETVGFQPPNSTFWNASGTRRGMKIFSHTACSDLGVERLGCCNHSTFTR